MSGEEGIRSPGVAQGTATPEAEAPGHLGADPFLRCRGAVVIAAFTEKAILVLTVGALVVARVEATQLKQRSRPITTDPDVAATMLFWGDVHDPDPSERAFSVHLTRAHHLASLAISYAHNQKFTMADFLADRAVRSAKQTGVEGDEDRFIRVQSYIQRLRFGEGTKLPQGLQQVLDDMGNHLEGEWDSDSRAFSRKWWHLQDRARRELEREYLYPEEK